MPDKFDRYREALVVETVTAWPPESSQLDATRRQDIEKRLHEDPSACSQLEYIRLPTGFCRKITVTPEDLARLS